MKPTPLLIPSLFMLIAAPLLGQNSPTGEGTPVERGERPLGITLRAGVMHEFEADVDTTPAQELQITRSELGAAYKQRAGDGFMRAGAFYEYSQYDFSGTANDLDVTGLVFDLFYEQPLSGNWGLFTMGGVRSYAEEDASFGDGVTATLSAGATYAFTDRFKLYAGVGYGTRLEDSDALYPAVGIDWKLTDDLHLRTANGAFLTYDTALMDRDVSLQGSLVYDARDIALDDTPAAGNRALEDKGWTLGLSATTWFADGWYLEPAIRIVFERELETRTERAGVTEIEQDTTVGLGLEVGYAF